jgi:hypothetical protein
MNEAPLALPLARPWLAARLWLFVFLALASMLARWWIAPPPAATDAALAQDLEGVARPARLHARAAERGFVESEPVVVTGIGQVHRVVMAGGEISVDGRPFTVLPGWVRSGSQLRVRVRAPDGAQSEVTGLLVVGPARTRFTVRAAGTGVAELAFEGRDAGLAKSGR